MAQPPIIGTSGQYNNARGNPRHSRTTAGQGNQNIVNAVSNAYLLEDIAAGATGLVRFVDPATSEIDLVMTPILAKNISQVEFTKSSVCTYFRLPGITTPLLLIGEPNDPSNTEIPPLNQLAPSDFINVGEMVDVEELDLTSQLGFFLSFFDPDPQATDTDIYNVILRNRATTQDIEWVITEGDSDITDISSPPPPPITSGLQGTLEAINLFFANNTTGSAVTTINPGMVHTITIRIVAMDGRASERTYYVYGSESTATLLVSNTSIYVSPSGSNTTGDGSSALPYLTVTKAVETLYGKIIPPNVTVTIIVKDGTIVEDTGIAMTHVNGDRITIAGENTYSKSMTSVQSSSGSAGAWSVIVNLNNVTDIAVGDYAIIYTATGGTLPTYIAGCHEITNVDTGNSRITLASKHLAATAPSGAVAATVTIVKSIVEFTNGSHGISVTNNHTLGLITKCVLVGDATAFRYGINLFGGGVCNTGASVGFSNWYAGVSSQGSSMFTGRVAVSFCVYGVWLFDHGVFYSLSTSVCSGCTQAGLGVFRTSECQFESSLITGCTSGCESTINAVVDLFNTDITGPITWGVFIANNSYLNIESGSTEAGSAGTANMPSDIVVADGSYIHFQGAPDKVYKLATTLTITNLSEQTVPSMSFNVVAGEQWIVEVEGVASGNNTTGDASINLINTGTWVTARSNYQGTRYNGGGTLTTDAATAFSSTTHLAASPGLACVNGDGNFYPFRFVCQFDVSGSGTVSLVFGNTATAAGRDSVLQAGCRLSARRIKV